MFESLTEYLKKAISEHAFPGCSVGVVSSFGVWTGSAGNLTYEAGAAEVTENTVYDIASITKAIPVSLLTLMLVERRELSFDDCLYTIIPEYTGNYREQVTIKHLLTHTLPFGFRMSSLAVLPPEELLASILSAHLTAAPGTVFSYANATSILLGLVLERVMGLTLDNAADRFLFGPLGMKSTTFHPKRFDREIVAPTEFDDVQRDYVRGEVHDESARRFYPKIVGSAGLFSTVPDMLRCLSVLVDDGMCGNELLFDKSTICHMQENVLLPHFGNRASYGWELDQTFMGERRNEKCFGKTGFTGCSVVVDPVRKVGIVLLSNHVHPKRRDDRAVINTIRCTAADLIYDAIDSAR